MTSELPLKTSVRMREAHGDNVVRGVLRSFSGRSCSEPVSSPAPRNSLRAAHKHNRPNKIAGQVQSQKTRAAHLEKRSGLSGDN